MKKSLKYIIGVIIIVGIVFQFLITWHRTNDQTMENTIYKGQTVWINKAAVGAWFLGIKMPAMSTIKVNDVIYFAHPENADLALYQKPRLISRVLGKPGDMVQIKNKEFIINNTAIAAPDSAKFGYRIVFKQNTDVDTYLKKDNFKQSEKILDTLNIYEIPLTHAQADAIRSDSAIDYVRLLKTIKGGANRIFPKSMFKSWSEDNFGPLLIPKKGDVVNLSYRNYDVYKNIIEVIEGNTVRKHKDKIYINDKLANSYTIKENYYFVADDNRDRFNDSREWGLVPESYIIGKVMGVR